MINICTKTQLLVDFKITADILVLMHPLRQIPERVLHPTREGKIKNSFFTQVAGIVITKLRNSDALKAQRKWLYPKK